MKFGHFFDFTKTVGVARMNTVIKHDYKSQENWSDEAEQSRSRYFYE